MEAMEFLQSPDSEAEEKMVQPIFDTVRVETEVMPPLAELGRQLLAKAQEGDAEAVLELMRQGAPFTTDWLGTSALHWACQLNHIAVAEVLLRAGISRDARNKVDRTPLHVTAQWGFVDILKLLLANGVDVDARDMLHMAPLHWAAEYSHEECVRLLLEHGADPEAVNKFDKTADQIAFDNNRLDITHMIQEYAENPMRHVRRKEAKERQKKAAAAIKASIEKEKMLRIGAAQARALQMQAAGATTKPQTLTALPTVLQRAVNTHTTTAVKSPFKLQNEPVKEVRVLKIPRLKRLLPEPITIIKQENPLSVDTPIFPPVSENNTEKTMELLQAHGITMLPNEENTIVASAMQSGQKVVLTEAGKMALNLTERPLTLKGRPVKGLIKLPEGALKGKRVITIRADQLINMTKDRKVIINTEKIQRDNAISPVKPNHALQTHVKQVEQNVRINVPRSQNPAENNTQLTSSFTPEPQPDTQQSPSELLVEEVSVTEQKSEVDKLKRELIQSQMQVKHLREQFLKKEKEAFEYKRILELLDKT